MKKLFLFLLCTVFCISCLEEKDLPKDKTQQFEAIIANCDPFIDYVVPIKNGMTTIVLDGADTIAITSEPLTIKIPKIDNSLTRANDIPYEEHYVDNALMKNKDTYYAYWQAVMFEDTEKGDYDYNDLIFHVRNSHTKSNGVFKQTIKIQPIALGGIKTIKLGCILFDQTEHIISNDVRADLFNNEKGFINTKNADSPIRYKLVDRIVDYPLYLGTETSWIAWFIEVDGNRYYAISSDHKMEHYDSMFNKDGMPYGIVASEVKNGTFNYPEEMTSLFTMYSQFQSWVQGRASHIGKCDDEKAYKYCLGGILGEDGKTYKIWDYLDLK